MNIEYHKWWSSHIQHDMELKVYGHFGKPVLVFPAQSGRFYEFEDFGMVEACRYFIEAGKYKFYTVDSLDNESWANWSSHPADRARRHQDYDNYITQEVAPFIRNHCQNQELKFLTTGVSMGGYHSANFFFRHPDIFDAVISISGLHKLNYFVGDYFDDNIYFNSPLLYLQKMEDPWYLERYRQSRIVFCVGQGAWDEPMLADARALSQILTSKAVNHEMDIWGHDVNHDWPWWRKMLPLWLGKL